MTTVSNTQWQTNPLLQTSSPSTGINVQQAVDNQTSQFTGPIGQTMIPTGTTSPAPIPTPSPASVPTAPGVPSNVPDSTIQDLFAQAGVIQGGIDNLRNQEATVGQTFASPEFQTGPTFEEIYGAPIDDEAIRRQQLQLFQGQIDATNQIYDQMLNQSRMEGQGRLGSQRAMAARGGLLGSDFGAAQKQKVQSFNTDIERAVQAERMAKIGAITGEINKAVVAERADQRAAKQQGAENWLNWLKGDTERRQDNINLAATALLTQGIDPSTLDENELGAIAMEAGTTPQNIIMQYQQLASQQAAESAASDLKTRKTEAEIRKIEADIESGKVKTIGEGTMLYNTETGEFFKNPKTYAPTAASGLRVGGQTLNQSQVADVHATLQETRGADGYANTGAYMRELEGFVALGGDPKDFIKEYSPDIYINPGDPTRSFLQSQMKKTTQEQVEEKSAFELMVEQRMAEQSGQ